MSRSDARLPGPLTGGYHSIATSAASARVGPIGRDARAVYLTATETMHFAVGDATIVATGSDTHIGANESMLVRVPPGCHIAAVQNATAGVLHISEMDL